jgi:hypothetical protein
MDIWVAISPGNASKLVQVFTAFGMKDPQLTVGLFQERGKKRDENAMEFQLSSNTAISEYSMSLMPLVLSANLGL